MPPSDDFARSITGGTAKSKLEGRPWLRVLSDSNRYFGSQLTFGEAEEQQLRRDRTGRREPAGDRHHAWVGGVFESLGRSNPEIRQLELALRPHGYVTIFVDHEQSVAGDVKSVAVRARRLRTHLKRCLQGTDIDPSRIRVVEGDQLGTQTKLHSLANPAITCVYGSRAERQLFERANRIRRLIHQTVVGRQNPYSYFGCPPLLYVLDSREQTQIELTESRSDSSHVDVDRDPVPDERLLSSPHHLSFAGGNYRSFHYVHKSIIAVAATNAPNTLVYIGKRTDHKAGVAPSFEARRAVLDEFIRSQPWGRHCDVLVGLDPVDEYWICLWPGLDLFVGGEDTERFLGVINQARKLMGAEPLGYATMSRPDIWTGNTWVQNSSGTNLDMGPGL